MKLERQGLFVLFKGNGIICQMEDQKEVFNMMYIDEAFLALHFFLLSQRFIAFYHEAFEFSYV